MSVRARRIIGPTLAVVAAVFALLALVSGYLAHTILSSEQFADRASAALSSDAVSNEIGSRVSEQLVSAKPDLISVQPVIEQVIAGAVRSKPFEDLFAAAARDLHRSLFVKDANTVTLTLADIGTTARGALQAFAPKLAKQIPGGADVDVLTDKLPGIIATAATVADGVRALPWILLAIAVLAAAAALWASADRRRDIVVFGIGAMIAGVVGLVGLRVANVILLNRVDPGQSRDAIDATWDAFMGDLNTAVVIFAAAGAVITAAASSLLRPVDVGAPLRRAWELIATAPESPPLRLLRGLLLLGVGILIIVRNDLFLELLAVLIGIYIAYIGAAELMRLAIPHAAEQRAEDVHRGRTALITAGVTALVIIVAGVVFVRTGGADENPATIETVGCNGSEALCDATLDQVAFPSAHNAMSAVTNPHWLAGQQEAGFVQQLRDGIRGMLIDAHYGQPTESGTVKTDLSDLTAGERATYEKDLGPQALDAALRTRDRVVNSPTTGPRQVYLCHRFCELGAIPIDQAFRQYRDFLAANPDEVMVIVIEDYVAPRDIAAAVKESGLIDYVYKGPLGPPWPTLGEMVDTGGRVLMLAENDAGGGKIPWYHEGYEGTLQETPYTFKKADALLGQQRRASCQPNRGDTDGSLFLLNNWVDTTPVPKPSNAAKVNAEQALMKRIKLCERIRDLTANLIAVDFYRTGDLFKVTDKLNAKLGDTP